MKLLNILGFIAFTYVSISTAFAHAMTEPECFEFATHAYVTAVYRDNGKSLEETHQNYAEKYMAKLPEDTYLKDQADFEQVIEMMERVYNSPQPAEVIAEKEYASCIQRTADSEV